mmetsp:Transcript_32257/g.60238  ORF Transcript_32257/g.60238 Transcript_32257/m.60238 type:complete len:697 (-) Transcript_32257:50-2140(-)
MMEANKDTDELYLELETEDLELEAALDLEDAASEAAEFNEDTLDEDADAPDAEQQASEKESSPSRPLGKRKAFAVTQAWQPDMGDILQPNMGDMSLFGEAGLRDIEAALMIQKVCRGRQVRKQADQEKKRLEEMRHMRDQARTRQCQVDDSIRERVKHTMMEKAQAEGEEVLDLDEKQVEAEVRKERKNRVKQAQTEARHEIIRGKKAKRATLLKQASLAKEAFAEEDEEASSQSQEQVLERRRSWRETQERRHQAATMIQRVYRGHKARLDLRKQNDLDGGWLQEVTAALMIQRIMRGRGARNKLEKMKKKRADAAIKIQALVRGFFGRKNAKQKKEQIEAAALIQKRQRRSMYKGSPSGTYPFFTSNRPADNSKAMLKIKAAEKDLSIEKLDFEFDCIGGQGAVWLAAVLRHSQKIVTLNLKGNYMCDRGCQLLATGLLKNKHLKHLNLSWNSIGDEGVMVLCLAIAKSHCLKTLNLAFNRIGDDGAEALALAFDTNPVLKELDIQGNRFGWTAASWLVTACKKNKISLTLPMKEMVKTKSHHGKSFQKMCDSFFDSNIPMFLKEVYWPAFRTRWGILASQPLPKKPAEIRRMQDFVEVGAKIDTGLGELAQQGISMKAPSTPGADGKSKKNLGRLPSTPGGKSNKSDRSTTASSTNSSAGLGATTPSLPQISTAKKGQMQRSATAPQGLRRKL